MHRTQVTMNDTQKQKCPGVCPASSDHSATHNLMHSLLGSRCGPKHFTNRVKTAGIRPLPEATVWIQNIL